MGNRLGRGWPNNQLLRPAPKQLVVPVLFDVASAGINGTYATSDSYNLNPSAGACVICDVLTDRTATINSVTFGGSAMSVIAGPLTPTGLIGNASYARYALNGVPTGSQAFVISLSASAYVTSFAASYKNVTAIGAAQTTSGSGTALSQAVTCTAGQMIVQSFGSSHNYGFTGPSGGTNRYNQYAYAALDYNDASASTTFAVTLGASVTWAAMANVLI